MTCIVKGLKSKKALKERCDALNVDPKSEGFYISNPSAFPPGTYEFEGSSGNLPEGKTVIVTNHPKRSWFAQITRKDGKLKVT